jgi:predicted nucleic acid-binding protein
MILVLDASPIIAFYSQNELNEPNLLHQFSNNGYTLITPLSVFEEIRAGRKPTFDILTEATTHKIIEINNEITSQETLVFGKRNPHLHNGEIQVLLIGLKLKASKIPYYCSIDEGPARSVAERNGIATKGTKGLVVLLNELGIIGKDKMESLLYRLSHCNFRL